MKEKIKERKIGIEYWKMCSKLIINVYIKWLMLFDEKIEVLWVVEVGFIIF